MPVSKLGKRITVRAHCEMSDSRIAFVRGVLRKEIASNPKWATDDLQADVIAEQVWNALVGISDPDAQ